MADLRIGCSSWTSPAWSGRFYPTGIKDGERLAFYAQRFNAVEVDSTYYAAPRSFVVQSWARKTPDDFRFALKFPRDLMDPRKPAEPGKISEFVATAQLLGERLGPILLQFPPWFKPPGLPDPTAGNAAFLRAIISKLPEGPQYAVELRNAAWFDGIHQGWLERLLKGRGISSCWSSLTYIDVPPLVTANWLYLRFIGDHDTIPAETHGEIRVDKTEETRKWVKRLRGVETSHAWVFFNNHYAGYAPESVELFKREMEP